MGHYVLQPLKVVTPKQKVLISLHDPISLHAGDIVFVSGENGSGKSVFLNLLAGNIGYIHSSNYQGLSVWSKTEKSGVIFYSNQEKVITLPPKINHESEFFSRIIHFQSDDKDDQIIYNLNLYKQFHIPFLASDDYPKLKPYIDELILGNKNQTYSLFDEMEQELITYPSDAFFRLPYLYKMARIISKREELASLKKKPLAISQKEFYKLSSGQKQLLTFYYLLIQWKIKNPEVVLLDEPLNYLDIRNRDLVIDELSRAISHYQLQENPPIVVLISHCTLFSFLDPSSPLFKNVVHLHIDTKGNVMRKGEIQPSLHRCGHCQSDQLKEHQHDK